jgi:hypothetical protein
VRSNPARVRGSGFLEKKKGDHLSDPGTILVGSKKSGLTALAPSGVSDVEQVSISCIGFGRDICIQLNLVPIFELQLQRCKNLQHHE